MNICMFDYKSKTIEGEVVNVCPLLEDLLPTFNLNLKNQPMASGISIQPFKIKRSPTG